VFFYAQYKIREEKFILRRNDEGTTSGSTNKSTFHEVFFLLFDPLPLACSEASPRSSFIYVKGGEVYPEDTNT